MIHDFAFDRIVPAQVPIKGGILQGDLYLPKNSRLLVIFAHGSGSSRFSPRNRYVAGILNAYHMGTLLIDLLTPEEEHIDNMTRELRFDIPMLADRLIAIALWTGNQPELKSLDLAYFGASTGGGAALIAAAKYPDRITSVVSRGGRPDLAGEFLPRVKTPSLLLVGERDEIVITLNRNALAQLNRQSKLSVVPHATHLFEEPGTLEEAAQQAAEWFAGHTGVTNKGS